jgi:hypothetical protein
MFILRPIIFIVTLAFGFVLSQNLDGILKIREGVFDLATSFVEKSPSQESGALEISAPTVNVSKYLAPEYWKYGVIVVWLFAGLFTASLVSTLLLGFLGGILFSPEISAVPILSEQAVLLSNAVKDLIRQLVN